jgi:hypothetical protein
MNFFHDIVSQKSLICDFDSYSDQLWLLSPGLMVAWKA